MHDQPGFWDTQPVTTLVAAERAWLEARRVMWPQATEVWVDPAEVPAERGCVSLALDATGRLAGPMVARSDLLPFADDSVQRVVLQHALDLRPAPRALLGEAVRALVPGGFLVVFGFDALSPTIWRCRIARRASRRAVGMQLPARLALLGAPAGPVRYPSLRFFRRGCARVRRRLAATGLCAGGAQELAQRDRPAPHGACARRGGGRPDAEREPAREACR